MLFGAASPGQQSFGDLSWKAPCRLATIAALPANTRTGNVLNANANGALPTIDGVAPAVGNRILVKNEATTANNGLYVVNDLGSAGTKWKMTRTSDTDTAREAVRGASTLIYGGFTLLGTLWTALAAWNLNVNDPGFGCFSKTTSITVTPADAVAGDSIIRLNANATKKTQLLGFVTGGADFEWSLDSLTGLAFGPVGGGVARDVALVRTGVKAAQIDDTAGGAADLTIQGNLAVVGSITNIGAITTVTPAITNGGTATYTTRSASYYVVGGLVWWSVELVINAAGAGGGTIQIALPFAPATRNQVIGGFAVGFATFLDGPVYGLANSGAAILAAIRDRTNANLLRSHFVNGAVLRMTGVYNVQ